MITGPTPTFIHSRVPCTVQHGKRKTKEMNKLKRREEVSVPEQCSVGKYQILKYLKCAIVLMRCYVKKELQSL